MARLIDADKLRMFLDRQYHNCHGYSGNKKEVYREALQAVKSYVHREGQINTVNGVTVQEWISVEERLPEDGVRVLAAHDDGVVRIGICRGYFPAIVSKKHTKTFGIAEVTHWMPLPEPPKGI